MILIWGNGGHARVVSESISTYRHTFREWSPGGLPPSAEGFDACVLGFGDIKSRRQLVDALPRTTVWAICPHPKSAVLVPTGDLGEGTFVAAGAVVCAGAKIGRHVIVNTCASVDHDCVVGDHCHVAPGARLLGRVKLGVGVFVGANAVVCPNVSIGDGAFIGAGVVVSRDVLPGVKITVNQGGTYYTRLYVEKI